MVATASLSRYGNRKLKERKVDSIVVDKEFIGCEQNSIWPVANSLQKMLKQSTVTVNA
jgi:hypothetical protein